ncbi:uncharacterized protein METZ01_LOCUS21456 [marine metagenome]|uniref:Uncharacterized protein n=1 Tax=marine metagenome TaxID=408172 RepID=A0A381PNK3_9ZZZZ
MLVKELLQPISELKLVYFLLADK